MSTVTGTGGAGLFATPPPQARATGSRLAKERLGRIWQTARFKSGGANHQWLPVSGSTPSMPDMTAPLTAVVPISGSKEYKGALQQPVCELIMAACSS